MAAVLSEGVISAFEQSRSFNDALERIAHVERIAVWDPTFGPRLREAVRKNDQIAKAFGVPHRVEALIERFEGSQVDAAQ